jgi:hypothetical protein
MAFNKEATKAVIDALKEHCADRHEMLTVLMHVVAVLLKQEQMTPPQVAAYLLKITEMLDGKFDRG